MIDIHTHHLQAFEKNKIIVLNQTMSDRVSETVSTDEKYFTFKTFGLHPWWLDKNKFSVGLDILETLLKENKIIAIGECGLDKLRGPDLEFQIKIFEAQLQLAKQYQKPVIIHCVRAFNELIATTKKSLTPASKSVNSIPLIIHGFNNNKNVLKSLVDAGFYISIGTTIFIEDNEKSWRERLKMIPPEKLFLETDESVENIEQIYKRAAYLLNVSVEVLEKQIEKNFEHVFHS